jgi:hypothetical protein
VVRVGHKLGHLGKTKTKRCWEKSTGSLSCMIDTAIDQCYECKVTTKDNQSLQPCYDWQEKKLPGSRSGTLYQFPSKQRENEAHFRHLRYAEKNRNRQWDHHSTPENLKNLDEKKDLNIIT